MTMFAADLPLLWLNDHKQAVCQGLRARYRRASS